MKKVLKISLGFTVLALFFGAFYREYTKYLGFDGATTLSLLHTHTFVLAVIFPLLFTLITEQLKHTTEELKLSFRTYYLGYTLAILAMLTRGLMQAQERVLSSEIDHMISGIAGLGHVVLAVAFVWIFYKLIKWSK